MRIELLLLFCRFWVILYSGSSSESAAQRIYVLLLHHPLPQSRTETGGLLMNLLHMKYAVEIAEAK